MDDCFPYIRRFISHHYATFYSSQYIRLNRFGCAFADIHHIRHNTNNISYNRCICNEHGSGFQQHPQTLWDIFRHLLLQRRSPSMYPLQLQPFRLRLRRHLLPQPRLSIYFDRHCHFDLNSHRYGADPSEPDFGGPDGNAIVLGNGMSVEFNLSGFFLDGNSVWDVVYSEKEETSSAGKIHLGAVLIEVYDETTAAWYTIYNWGDGAIDANASYNNGNSEPDGFPSG